MRRLRRLPLEQLAPVLLELPRLPPGETPSAWRWLAVFGNDRPVEIEVGFGKGLFLVTESQARPEANFLGIEIVRKYVLFTANRLAKRHRGNVRLVTGDARLILQQHVAETSVDALHIYYPDPWWKKRHLKRRVFNAEFVPQCARVLRLGGRLHVVTDVEEYSQVIAEMLGQEPRLRFLGRPNLRLPAHDLDYLTNFDRKFRKEGKSVFGGVYERLF